MSKNVGKIFEEDFKKSFNDNYWVYRLRDNAASFGGGNTRFASSNICDFVVWNTQTRNLYLTELKSTKNTSMSYELIRDNQRDGLTEVSKYGIIACFVFNFREKNNATYFLTIQNFNKMKENSLKKSFNEKDLQEYGAFQIDSSLKKTRYTYCVDSVFR